MSRNQIILLILLSVVFGLGAVFFAKQWMDRQVQPQQKVETVERLPVVVAVMDIPSGTTIEEKFLTTKLLEKSWISDKQFSDVKDVIGKISATNIYPDEIIVSQRVSLPGEGSTLAALIPEDKRAVTIRVNDVIGVAGFLLPGNKVDILNTVNSYTSTVLKDIKVLAVDQTAKTKDNKPIIVRAVTLEVSPREAEKLMSAMSRGSIQLALRNPRAIEEKVIKYVPPPSVTIIKGTDSSNIRVKN